MISKLGDNLTVLLVAKVEEDWQAFGTWYSVQKNLPYAKCLLTYIRRDHETPFQMFQWAKRVGLKTIGVTSRKADPLVDYLACLVAAYNEVGSKRFLLLPSHCIVTDALSDELVEKFNEHQLWMDTECMLPAYSAMNSLALENAYNDSVLGSELSHVQKTTICREAKSEEPHSIVSYRKGCGRWIDKMKGCPYSSAGGLIEEIMTVNESRIISLWEKMVCLYSSVA